MNKFCLVFLAIIATVTCTGLSDEQKAKLKEHHTECAKLSGVDEELIKRAREGDFADDPKLKEHIYCVSKRIGFQNEDGEFQKDVLKTKLNSVLKDVEKTEALMKKCCKKADTPKDSAFESIKCYFDTVKIL